MTTPAWLKDWKVRRKIRHYQKSGSWPWTRGYQEYKEMEIRRILESRVFDPELLPPNLGVGLDERIVEIPWLFSRIRQGQGRFLDAGSALNQEFYLNQPGLAGKEIHIVTLAPEETCAWKSGVSYLFQDLRHLPYRDAWFDEIACISTLEHIGMDNTRLYTSNPAFRENSPQEVGRAIREFFRVLRPGGTVWLTVPVGKPADLGWLQIFSPSDLEGLVTAAGFTSAGAWYYQYTARGWRRAQAPEVGGETYFDWHQNKTYDADRVAAARAVGCWELVKK